MTRQLNGNSTISQKGFGPPDSKLFENLITVEELAGVLGIAPKTLRNWVSMRSIPFLRVGRKTRFRRRSIEAWLTRKETKSWQ